MFVASFRQVIYTILKCLLNSSHSVFDSSMNTRT